MNGKSIRWIIEEALNISASPTTLEKFLFQANEVLKNEKKRMTEWILEKEGNTPFIIVGDLHGDLETLKKILSRIGESSIAKGDLTMVFLGDYIDRGPYQLETITSVLLLKERFPNQVVLLRGNHEPPPELIPYPHDFPDELRQKLGFQAGSEIYQFFLELFQNLPAVLHVRREALMVHGGLPTLTFKKEVTLYEYLTGKHPGEKGSVLKEILWNDPVESPSPAIPSPRGAGYLFGKPVTEWVIKKFKVKEIFRGHEPVYNGYKFNHEGRVMTVFSRLGPPYFNKRAAYVVVDMSLNSWWRRLKHFIVSLTE